MIKLSEKWVKELLSKSETGMGYQVVSIVTKNGNRFDQAVILQACLITGIKGLNDIPFKEDDISQIILTHDKWDFNAERLMKEREKKEKDV
ncbi:MAG: hypothetical protein ABSC11_10755 [Smithella sp.]|jgi:hypothetical protein